jgi:hypothetical protein
MTAITHAARLACDFTRFTQVWRGSSARAGPGQQSIQQAFQQSSTSRAPPLLLAADVGAAPPSHRVIREWVVNSAEARADYQFAWRQQHVSGTIIQLDHHLKVNRGNSVQSIKLCNNRLTVWSSQLNAPLLSINTDTTSLNDGAFVLAAEAMRSVYSDAQREPVALAYVDNPHRDEKGLVRAFPSLASGVDGTADGGDGVAGERPPRL